MAYTPYNNTIKSLTGELSKIERDIAKYLFRKYLVPPNTPETKEQIRSRREIFIQELFPTRPETIQQDDELVSELDEIARATEEYTRCPDDYPTGRTQWGYPDSLRCKHISYVKHRFTRCACKISTVSTGLLLVAQSGATAFSLNSQPPGVGLEFNVNGTTPTSNPRPFCTKHFGDDNPHAAEYNTLVAALSTLQNQTTN